MKSKKVDPIEQSEKFIEFLKKALNSENFKNEAKHDPIQKAKYEKMQRQYDKEKLKLKFLNIDKK